MPHLTHPPFTYERQPQHRDHPTLIRIVRGFFNVPQNYQHSRNCETGPPVYRPYPRRLESLTICRWNYKGSTFLLSYFKTLSVGPVGVSNSRPPASQPGAQPSEPPVRGWIRNKVNKIGCCVLLTKIHLEDWSKKSPSLLNFDILFCFSSSKTETGECLPKKMVSYNGRRRSVTGPASALRMQKW